MNEPGGKSERGYPRSKKTDAQKTNQALRRKLKSLRMENQLLRNFDRRLVACQTSTRNGNKLVLDTIKQAMKKEGSLKSAISTVTKVFNTLLPHISA